MKKLLPRTWRVLAALTLSLTFCVGAATFPGTSWETRTPAAVGLDVAKLNAIQSYLGGRGCIVRNGYLVYTWGDVTTRGDVASAAKPWYSTLLFKAVEEGRLASLDTLAVGYEPGLSTLNASLGYKAPDSQHKDKRELFGEGGSGTARGVPNPGGAEASLLMMLVSYSEVISSLRPSSRRAALVSSIFCLEMPPSGATSTVSFNFSPLAVANLGRTAV